VSFVRQVQKVWEKPAASCCKVPSILTTTECHILDSHTFNSLLWEPQISYNTNEMVVFWVSMNEHSVITWKTTILTRPAVEACTQAINIGIYWRTNRILPDDLIHYICKMWYTKTRHERFKLSCLGVAIDYLKTGTGEAWARHNRDIADLWGVISLLEPTLLSFSVGATLVWGSVCLYNKTGVGQWQTTEFRTGCSPSHAITTSALLLKYNTNPDTTTLYWKTYHYSMNKQLWKYFL